jgi:peptide deformylase
VIRPILKLGAPQLTTSSAAVEAITAKTQTLIDDLIETMHAAPGIGLAAPQLGTLQRVFVLDLSVGRRAEDLAVCINPEILSRDGLQLEEEGCLSVPGFTATVLRPARIAVRAMNRGGEVRVIEGTGLLARALQHEIDHLDGLLYLHRLRGIQRVVIEKRVRTLEHRGRW